MHQSQELVIDSKKQVHCLVLNKIFETNDLESLRENMAEKGLSNTAAQILSQIAEDQALQLITNWPGKNCLAGVVNDRLIRLHAV